MVKPWLLIAAADPVAVRLTLALVAATPQAADNLGLRLRVMLAAASCGRCCGGRSCQGVQGGGTESRLQLL